MPDQRNYYSSEFKLGILGGGQLGKMLLDVTRRYDIHTKVMDPSAEAPSSIGCNEFVQGNITDKDDVLNFGSDCDILTIEIENVNTEALKELEEKGVKVYPRPDTLEIIKDKAAQKMFYREKGIPTSPFHTFNNRQEMEEILDRGDVKIPFVWKAGSGGYDGRGVQVVKTEEDLESIPDVPGLIEDYINFDAELAIIAARSEMGNVVCYPVVEMEFHPQANQVEYVFSPTQIDEPIQNKAKILAEQIINELDHVGLLAIELFVTEDNLLVNEMAPRVHNSGHLTIEGNVTSQFEQHIRAILNLPLGDTSIVKPAVMVNLTGAEGFEGPVEYEGIEQVLSLPGAYVHLYGKSQTRPFRKMGHITLTAENLDEARKLAAKVKETINVKSR